LDNDEEEIRFNTKKKTEKQNIKKEPLLNLDNFDDEDDYLGDLEKFDLPDGIGSDDEYYKSIAQKKKKKKEKIKLVNFSNFL
jgi:hypothetical protein